ncbi:HAD-superfamily hydrolase, subfamily IG, 5'-nucleotidase [Dillenia turbinata]|uniref:HAD-superfamily hydrolase, subfamily IG, 5'-nucleotidase n=1 Tax=Dillenia turbinata TaxID=194707 RepID=A0AAN8ZS12_9MAGN
MRGQARTPQSSFILLRSLEAQRRTRRFNVNPTTTPATKKKAQSLEHVNTDTACLQLDKKGQQNFNSSVIKEITVNIKCTKSERKENQMKSCQRRVGESWELIVDWMDELQRSRIDQKIQQKKTQKQLVKMKKKKSLLSLGFHWKLPCTLSVTLPSTPPKSYSYYFGFGFLSFGFKTPSKVRLGFYSHLSRPTRTRFPTTRKFRISFIMYCRMTSNHLRCGSRNGNLDPCIWSSCEDGCKIDIQKPIFCDRSLNIKNIVAVGFDMDYTLVQYILETFKSLAYEGIVGKLVDDLGYPSQLLHWMFDWTNMVRGLVLDKKRGNILKMENPDLCIINILFYYFG